MKIFATSDTHNKKGWINCIPEDADIILHAGDLSDTGSEFEIERIVMDLDLIGKPVFVCPGNHDIELQYNREFTDRLRETYPNVFISTKAEHVVFTCKGIEYKMFVNPYVVEFGPWAYGVKEEELHNYLPDSDTDIILCHCPPSHEDLSNYDWHGHGIVDIGNKALTEHLWAINSQGGILICGHNHLPYVSTAQIGNFVCFNVATHQILLAG